MAASDLYDLCAEYLAACQAAVATAPGGAIERAFVSPGDPALDCCPQLTVHAGGPIDSDTAPLSPPLSPGQRPNVQGSVYLANMTATVIRCSPTFAGEDVLDLPASEDIEASAMLTLADVWAIWNFVRTEYKNGILFASPSGRREIFFDPALPLPIEGGCAGWRIPIRVQLGGYETVSP